MPGPPVSVPLQLTVKLAEVSIDGSAATLLVGVPTAGTSNANSEVSPPGSVAVAVTNQPAGTVNG